jgi:hypothetical protein
LLSAGKGVLPPKMAAAKFNSKHLQTIAQRYIKGSIVYNSKDPLMYAKVRHLLFRTCNDGDLSDFMIGQGIRVVLKQRFWHAEAPKNRRDLKATPIDTIVHDDGKPFEVQVLVEEPGRKDPTKTTYYTTEVLVSMDPTVDGTKEIHKNCLREAIMDTYPKARTDPKFTLQNLLDMHRNRGLRLAKGLPELEEDESEPLDKDSSGSSSEEEIPSEPEEEPARAPTPEPAPKEAPDGKPKRHRRKGKGTKHKQNATSNTDPNEEQPKPQTRRRSKLFANQASHAVRKIITCTQAYFGVDSASTTFDQLKEDKKQFRMRNDTKGASFAAFFATIQVCAMASSLGYNLQFLPLEPRNQRDARQ